MASTGIMFLFLVMLSLSSSVSSQTPSSIPTKCASEVTKVTACLQFATAKTETPSKECCDAATSMRISNPACMCYIIEEVHQGAPSLKDMGLQVDRLLQLPSQCTIPNTTLTDCPSLLNLPKDSPEYRFFVDTNTSKAASGPPQSEAQESGKNGANATAKSVWCNLMSLFLMASGIAVFIP